MVFCLEFEFVDEIVLVDLGLEERFFNLKLCFDILIRFIGRL